LQRDRKRFAQNKPHTYAILKGNIVASSAWVVFDSAKHKIGNGTINLSADTFRLSLHRTSASANVVGANSVFSEIGEECVGGGYVAKTLDSVTWAAGTSAGQQAYDTADMTLTASASAISSVRYAVIRKSTGSTTSGFLLAYSALSTSQFDVTTGQIMTIAMASTGIFTLA
jgi:hypothetical protein